MKILKHILVAILIILISGLSTYYLKPDSPVQILIIIPMVVFFVFNLIIRKSLLYKNYFTSPYNLLTTKARFEKTFDIPKELMFEKMIEVIDNSKFKLVDTDKNTFEILAISTITFKSWGENLYINFETIENQTILKFCSSTLFQLYSWGKNEENYNALLNEIESSLTI
ncbi:hypothetical protein [Formosa sp. Hel1_33_131]|uniref:hypothetical protein n=1 Tax=Formosa sp. Hel1_33_131 TaxID=1336794 RepID=UPI00084E1058|nr:hypothetical protein [Formosa sp. Hel1_33_131]